jgi:glycosyltransferase involved in cell wall biosynthesis
MSEANRKYLSLHNPTINPEKIEVNPNSISPIAFDQTIEEKRTIKEKYGLPINKKIFVYGGNLGKPQGIDFLIETIGSNKNSDVCFLIVGFGTEYNKIYSWFQNNQPKNAVLLNGLPKQDYDILLNACDVGMIFLNKDFTIPNFPSRLLSYLEMKKPVIAATDANTDIGIEIEKNKCGYAVLSGDILTMQKVIDEISNDEVKYKLMAENAWNYLQKEFKVEYSYQLIKKRLENV